MLTNIIVGVFAVLLVGGIIWRTVISTKRAAVDPSYRRRRLIRWGMMYVIAALVAVVLVLTKQEPATTLIGLPVAVWLAWTFFRAGSRVKIPPS